MAKAQLRYLPAQEVVASRTVHSRSKCKISSKGFCKFLTKISLQINLGPISPSMAGETASSSPLAWNPRCAKRDLTSYASSTWLTFDNLYNVTLGAASENIGLFQDELQGRFPDGFLGMHAAGHFSIGGDGGDVFSSPNDPAFFLHHAMVDRVWW